MSTKKDSPVIENHSHCLKGRIMFPYRDPGKTWDAIKQKARAEYEISSGKAAMGLEEILEIEARLPAKARAGQSSPITLCNTRGAGTIDGSVGVFQGTLQGY